MTNAEARKHARTLAMNLAFWTVAGTVLGTCAGVVCGAVAAESMYRLGDYALRGFVAGVAGGVVVGMGISVLYLVGLGLGKSREG